MISIIAGFLSGLVGSMGLGGGTVLMIYLVGFANMEQIKAAGINLLFFIPIATLSVIIYSFKKQIKWKTALIFGASGLVGAALGTLLSGFVGNRWTKIAFAVLLIVLGIKALFAKKENKKSE